MIETVRIWNYYSYERELRKKHGSRRSGTIYIVASCPEEARQIVLDMYAQAGLSPKKSPIVSESQLIVKALRTIPCPSSNTNAPTDM